MGRRLLLSGAVGPSEIQARFTTISGRERRFIRALVEVGGISVRRARRRARTFGRAFARRRDPSPRGDRRIAEHLCHTLLAVPVRRDVRTGAVDVAVADPYDDTIADEFSFHLKTDVKLVRGSVVAIEDALKAAPSELERASKAAARESEPPRRRTSVRRAPSESAGTQGLARGRRVSSRKVGLATDRERHHRSPRRCADIVEQVEVDGGVTDELGQPILPLTTSKVPARAERAELRPRTREPF